MAKCSECGLLESLYCHRFEKEVPKEGLNVARDCLYFCQVIYEDGEPLTPRQHLIMQNKDLKSRNMRGPV